MIIGMKRIAIILALTLSCQLAPADDWHAALSIMDQSGMRGNDGYEIKAIVARVCGFPILLLYRQTLSNSDVIEQCYLSAVKCGRQTGSTCHLDPLDKTP